MFPEIIVEIIKTLLLFVAVVLLIIGFVFEPVIVKFEMPYRIRFRKWLSKLIMRIRKAIAAKLKRSVWFMNWLYKPSLSEQIENESNNVGVHVMNDWHNSECKAYCRSFYI